MPVLPKTDPLSDFLGGVGAAGKTAYDALRDFLGGEAQGFGEQFDLANYPPGTTPLQAVEQIALRAPFTYDDAQDRDNGMGY
jgi:hypothetical protein